jgi:hypothetical protein
MTGPDVKFNPPNLKLKIAIGLRCLFIQFESEMNVPTEVRSRYAELICNKFKLLNTLYTIRQIARLGNPVI